MTKRNKLRDNLEAARQKAAETAAALERSTAGWMRGENLSSV